eukprot:jgi/Ulvmu1/4516/UM002_0242.1
MCQFQMPFVLKRKSLSVAAAATVAFAWIYAANLTDGFESDFARIFQWAGITIVLIANPLLGGLARTSLDRCLGSFMGASVAMVGAYISTHAAFYVPLTTVVIYGFHVAGDKLSAAYSAKIAMLSFILVAGSCLNSSQAYWRIAIVRLAGIVLGVTLAQLASVVIYSKTHSDTAIARLRTSLRCTTELCEATWLAWHLTDKPHVPAFLTAPAEELKAALRQASHAHPNSLPGMIPTGAAQPIRPSDAGEGTGTLDSAPPGRSSPERVTSPTQATTPPPHVAALDASPHTLPAGAHGSPDGQQILGIIQAEDRSVIPVTPNLLTQLSRHAQRRLPDEPPSDQPASDPTMASPPAPSRIAMYQAVSAPELVSHAGVHPEPADPALAASRTASDSLMQAGNEDPPQQPHALRKFAFGSMQDLVQTSHSTSVGSPSSVQHSRSTSQVRPLAQPAVRSPLAPGGAAAPDNAPTADLLLTTPRLHGGEAVKNAAAAPHGPQAHAGLAPHSQDSETSFEEQVMEGGGTSEVTGARSPDAAASSTENKDSPRVDPGDQEGRAWAPAPPKVASVAAWLDTMPTWPQFPQGAGRPAQLARASLGSANPGSAAGGTTFRDTVVDVSALPDAENKDERGTMYQAWRRVLGDHDGAPKSAIATPESSPAPGLHKLSPASVFASPGTAPVAARPSEQTAESQGHTASAKPLKHSQPGIVFGSRRLSSLGWSTQSPHQTRITWDTAKSYRSMESVPASEIQWLLQVMGSALESTELMQPGSAHSTPMHGAAAAADHSGSKLSGSVGHANRGPDQRNGAGPPVFGACAGGAPPAAAADAQTLPWAPGAPNGLQVSAEQVLGWDDEKQATSDRRCEDLLMTILQETSQVELDVQGTMGEVLVHFWGIQLFLPRPVSSLQVQRRNHMPKAAIGNLVGSIRVTARILWALHTTLRKGFTRDMVMLLKHTYPAALMSDLRHFSIAALHDVCSVFPEGFVARSAANVPPENLRRFISTVEALVTISRANGADGLDDRTSLIYSPQQVNPQLGLSSPSLPSQHASPLQAKAFPAAGPVAESVVESAGLRLTAVDSIAQSQDGTAASMPPQRSSDSGRHSNDRCGGVFPTAPVPLAKSPDAGGFGLDACPGSPDRGRHMQRRLSGLSFAGIFGRSTHGSSLHQHTSKVSRLSWDTARKDGQAGPRWTQALIFPMTVEGFLARVRWQAFQQDLTQLAEQMMRLHQTAKNVMLHLPGPGGVADPTLVPDTDLF